MWKNIRFGILGMTLIAAGCAGSSVVLTVTPGESVVNIKASSFEFNPGIIMAQQGDRLTLAIENISGSEHNITVKDPAGQVLVTKDLPAHETIRIEVPLSQAGEYLFYCDKPFHPTFGMKGRLVAE